MPIVSGRVVGLRFGLALGLGKLHNIAGPYIPVLFLVVYFAVRSFVVFPKDDIVEGISNPVKISFVLLGPQLDG